MKDWAPWLALAIVAVFWLHSERQAARTDALLEAAHDSAKVSEERRLQADAQHALERADWQRRNGVMETRMGVMNLREDSIGRELVVARAELRAVMPERLLPQYDSIVSAYGLRLALKDSVILTLTEQRDEARAMEAFAIRERDAWKAQSSVWREQAEGWKSRRLPRLGCGPVVAGVLWPAVGAGVGVGCVIRM